MSGGVGLENRLDEAVKSNERLQKENELFESYLRRHSAGMEVLEEDVKTPKHKKRGKDRHKVPVSLTTEQKVTVASSEADEVQKEIKETKKNSEKLIDTLRVRGGIVDVVVCCCPCVCVCGCWDRGAGWGLCSVLGLCVFGARQRRRRGGARTKQRALRDATEEPNYPPSSSAPPLLPQRPSLKKPTFALPS